MFCCKGKRLANYLIEHGSKIVRIETDRNNSEYLVFLFQNDDSIRKNLMNWKEDRATYHHKIEANETKTEEVTND